VNGLRATLVTLITGNALVRVHESSREADPAAEIQKYATLKDQGLITEEELTAIHADDRRPLQYTT